MTAVENQVIIIVNYFDALFLVTVSPCILMYFHICQSQIHYYILVS